VVYESSPTKLHELVYPASLVMLLLMALVRQCMSRSARSKLDFSRLGYLANRSKCWKCCDFFCCGLIMSVSDLTYGECVSVAWYFLAVIAVMVMSVYDSRTGGRKDNEVYVFMSGHLLQLNLALTMLPVTKNTIWLQTLYGISFERAVKFHRVIAGFTVLSAVAHAGLMYVFRLNLGDNSTWWDGLVSFQPTPQGSGVVYGSVSLLCMVMMAIFAQNWLRRCSYEAFYVVHVSLMPVVIASAVLHNHPTGYLMAGPVGLWLLDRALALRKRKCSSPVEVISADMLGEKPSRVLYLKVRKPGFVAEPGSFCWLACDLPGCARAEWHPFSISSGANKYSDGLLTFHIKDMGSWTFTRALCKAVISKGKDLKLELDGPYGAPTVDLKVYKNLILCAGGIGSSALMNILAHHASLPEVRVHSITLIWSNRDISPFTSWYVDIWNTPPVKALLQSGKLKLHFYVSRYGDFNLTKREKKPKRISGHVRLDDEELVEKDRKKKKKEIAEKTERQKTTITTTTKNKQITQTEDSNNNIYTYSSKA
jgi:hypothetical protein